MIRVATYNIRKSVGQDWRRRPDRVLAVLSEIDADIVALQEVDRRFGSVRGVAFERLQGSEGLVRNHRLFARVAGPPS